MFNFLISFQVICFSFEMEQLGWNYLTMAKIKDEGKREKVTSKER